MQIWNFLSNLFNKIYLENLSIKEKFGSNPFEDLESCNVYVVKVSASHCLWSHEPYISAEMEGWGSCFG